MLQCPTIPALAIVSASAISGCYVDPDSGDRIVTRNDTSPHYMFSYGKQPYLFYPLHCTSRGLELQARANLGDGPHVPLYESAGKTIEFGGVTYKSAPRPADAIRLVEYQNLHRIMYAFKMPDETCVLVTGPYAFKFSYAFEFYIGKPGKLEKIGAPTDWTVDRMRDGGTTYMENEEHRIRIHAPAPVTAKARANITMTRDGRKVKAAHHYPFSGHAAIERAFSIKLANFGIYDLDKVALMMPAH